VVELADTRS